MEYMQNKWNQWTSNANCHHHHGHSDGNNYYGARQMKAQTFKNNKMQKTQQTQQVLEQVDDTYQSIVTAATLAQNAAFNDDSVNMMTDAAVLSLNMFAVSCEEIHKESDKKLLKLIQKRVNDKFGTLELEDNNTFKLIKDYREYMNAAINGEKNLRFSEVRAENEDKPGLFDNNAQQINATFGKLIESRQKYDKRQKSFLDKDVNKELAAQHETQLKEFENKNKNTNKNKKNKHQKQAYIRPKISDLYFTKSGKASKFINKRVIEEKQAEEEELDTIMMGPQEEELDAFDKLAKKINFMNGILQLSQDNCLNLGDKVIKAPIPCHILEPTTEERAKKQYKSKLKIRLCKPYDYQIISAPESMIEFDEKLVKEQEDLYIMMFQSLGYDSIKQQEAIMNSMVNQGTSNNKTEKEELDAVMMGNEYKSQYEALNAFDSLKQKLNFMNCVLNLTEKKSIKLDNGQEIKKPVPCLLLQPTKEEAENECKQQLKIRLCKPYNYQPWIVPENMLELNEKIVKNTENIFIEMFGSLGYESIKEQEIATKKATNTQTINNITKQLQGVEFMNCDPGV